MVYIIYTIQYILYIIKYKLSIYIFLYILIYTEKEVKIYILTSFFLYYSINLFIFLNYSFAFKLKNILIILLAKLLSCFFSSLQICTSFNCVLKFVSCSKACSNSFSISSLSFSFRYFIILENFIPFDAFTKTISFSFNISKCCIISL